MIHSDLPAVLGGTPIFSTPHHLVRPPLPDRKLLDAGIDDLYRSRILSNQGKFVREFESKVAVYAGVKYCISFCNATIALLSLARALNLKGNVIVPSFTFAATAQALLWQDIVPKFVDIETDSFNLDPDLVEQAIDPATSAILAVHLFGTPCNHDRLREIAQRRGIPLLYDSAHALGSSYRGRPVGSLGDAEVFSFHATKLVHSGEGGAVVTNDKNLYDRLCRIRNFGFDGYLNCADIGLNGKLDEFSGLLGSLLMDQIEQIIATRTWVFGQYRESLKSIPGFTFPRQNLESGTHDNSSYFYVLVDPEKFGMSNLELNYALTQEGIITRLYFYPPIHRTKYYQDLFGEGTFVLPNSDWASLHLLCLPVYSNMEVEELAKVLRGIFRCHRHASAIRDKLVGILPSSWESLVRSPVADPHEILILREKESPSP